MHQNVAKTRFSTIFLRLPQSDPRVSCIPCTNLRAHWHISNASQLFRPSFMPLPPSVRSPWSNHTHVRGLFNSKDPGLFLPIIQGSIAGIPTLAVSLKFRGHFLLSRYH